SQKLQGHGQQVRPTAAQNSVRQPLYRTPVASQWTVRYVFKPILYPVLKRSVLGEYFSCGGDLALCEPVPYWTWLLLVQ
ncbi:hypothetical protein COCON_G00085410, partial [Conger conger]